jgi:hypothetical protein
MLRGGNKNVLKTSPGKKVTANHHPTRNPVIHQASLPSSHPRFSGTLALLDHAARCHNSQVSLPVADEHMHIAVDMRTPCGSDQTWSPNRPASTGTPRTEPRRPLFEASSSPPPADREIRRRTAHGSPVALLTCKSQVQTICQSSPRETAPLKDVVVTRARVPARPPNRPRRDKASQPPPISDHHPASADPSQASGSSHSQLS